MELFADVALAEIVSMIIFTVLGVVLMGLCWWVIDKLTHFSITREIEEDQNVALAILIGSVFISLAIIIAAVVTS